MRNDSITSSDRNQSNEIDFKTIAPFLNTNQNKFSRLFSYAGLLVGVFLLLASLQIFINISNLLKDKNPRKDGYDFLSITKTITNQNMGNDNRFTDAEINEIKSQPFIKDAAPLISNQFRAKASAGTIIPFSTDLFLESVKNDFLDTIPETFTWQPGQADIPVIFSADFLEMYNVFAPAQDLPQLSENSIGAINITLECYGPQGIQNFRGHIVAVTDRINSVLVPESFLQWANKTYGNTMNSPAARVFIKTPDANNADLLSFLEKKNFHANKDKTKFGRIKQVLQAIVTGLGGFAILVILLAMMLFSFYLQLMITRSKDNLQLLLTLGYSPVWLTKIVAKKWVGVYTSLICLALALTALCQFLLKSFSLNGRDGLSPFIDYSVILLAMFLLFLCIMINYKLVKKLLSRL